MNKTETKALWRALCACTCKSGVNAPFDCVCVHDRVIYVTDTYVMHRIEGLYQPGSIFKALFGHSIAYMDRARTFNAILDYDPDDRDFSGMLLTTTLLVSRSRCDLIGRWDQRICSFTIARAASA